MPPILLLDELPLQRRASTDMPSLQSGCNSQVFERKLVGLCLLHS